MSSDCKADLIVSKSMVRTGDLGCESCVQVSGEKGYGKIEEKHTLMFVVFLEWIDEVWLLLFGN